VIKIVGIVAKGDFIKEHISAWTLDISKIRP
jgi:hypothetical protein